MKNGQVIWNVSTQRLYKLWVTKSWSLMKVLKTCKKAFLLPFSVTAKHGSINKIEQF